MAELRESSDVEREPMGVDSRGADGLAAPQQPGDVIYPNLSHWISCFCVVTFDLELGQALEVCCSDTSIT